MHKTDAGEKRKALKREAQVLASKAKTMMKAAEITPIVKSKAKELQVKADNAQAQAQALKLEARLEDVCTPTEDHAEARAAFLEKRKANLKGK